ncbi:hypothetical protein LOZ67_005189 [Ophidiomyces ophidiicola]|nr:hypothetical protein LOZ67_005189 [Ophidiomyces ophidiicola]
MAYLHDAPPNAALPNLPPHSPLNSTPQLPADTPPDVTRNMPPCPTVHLDSSAVQAQPESFPSNPATHAQSHPVPPSLLPNPPPGYLMLPIPFPVKPLFNNILNAPENIGEMRQRFFSLETPIVQSPYEHEIYWPFVGNFWVRNKVKDSTDCRTEYYWCRLFRKQDQKSAVPPELRKRKCTIRSAVGCEMKLRKRFWKDGTVEISNHGTCNAHCHSLDDMDQIKRNSGVRLAIGNEIGKGYKPTEVKRVLLKNQDILTAAGGQCITIKDCHNAALVHNKESKEQLPPRKEDNQPGVRENMQEDEPMIGQILQEHTPREAEALDKMSIEVQPQASAELTASSLRKVSKGGSNSEAIDQTS